MSAIASFYCFPTNKLIGLREVWPDTYPYLKEYRQKDLHYNWSGYCMAALMDYLKLKKIDLSTSDYHSLFPGALDEGTWFLDKPLKDQYFKKLNPKHFTDKELLKGLQQWFPDDGPETAEPMRDGILLLKKSFEMVDDHTLVMMHVG